MSGSIQFSFPSAPWFLAAILIAILGTSACTRSNASAADAHAASAQASKPSQPQTENASTAKPNIEFEAALREAQSGDASAMYRLGRIYATGSGVERDYVEAFNWYKRAAKAGNTDAMYALGEAYEHGTGVRDDIQQAVNWYDQATLRGNKKAKAALQRLGEDFDR